MMHPLSEIYLNNVYNVPMTVNMLDEFTRSVLVTKCFLSCQWAKLKYANHWYTI